MSRHRTFRILLTRPEQLFIDVVARDESHAVERAEAEWYRGERNRFEKLLSCGDLEFEPDEQSCLHLGDIRNDDRSDWAEHALRAFAAKTHAGLCEDGIGDLIADLGHYADRHDIEYLDVVARAIGAWALERKDSDNGKPLPSVKITVSEGGAP